MREAHSSEAARATSVAEAAALPSIVSRVLESRSFEKSPTLRALMIYLWQHRDESISEYAVATEALGRGPLFNAKTDATVRVQISRLRQRLEKFYEREGQDCTERLVVPLGSHQVQVEPGAVAVTAAPLDSIAPVWRNSRGVAILSAACGVLLILSAGLAVALYRTPVPARAGAAQDPPRFWKAFFGNGRHTRIIIPTPVFLSFAAHPEESVMLRDTQVNDFAARETSAGYRALEKLMGPPQLAQNYTVTSDTFAAVKLARYLDQAGLMTTVVSSADAPLEALDSENMVAIGTWGTLTPMKPYLDSMNFVLGLHEEFVEVRRPLPGGPRRVDWVKESPERTVWPGVIAVLPGPGRRTRLLILASRHTSSLVSLLTSVDGLDQLERLWKAKGRPEYYEMIVKSEMNGADLVRFWPVALQAH